MNNRYVNIFSFVLILVVIGCTGVEEVGIKSGKWEVDKDTGKTTASFPGLVIRSEDDQTAYQNMQSVESQYIRQMAMSQFDEQLARKIELLRADGYVVTEITTDEYGNKKIKVVKPEIEVVVQEPVQQSRGIRVEQYSQEQLSVPIEHSYENEEGSVLLQKPTPIPTPTKREVETKIIESPRPISAPTITEVEIDSSIECLNKELGLFGQRFVLNLRRIYNNFETCSPFSEDIQVDPIPIVFREKKIIIISSSRQAEIGALRDANYRIIPVSSEDIKQGYEKRNSMVMELLKCYYESE